jgi:hypothetical protein
MQDQSSVAPGSEATSDDTLVGGALIDGAFINNDLGIVSRTRREYVARGILPRPTTNLLGRDLWLLRTYVAFKARLIAGQFSLDKGQHLRGPRAER